MSALNFGVIVGFTVIGIALYINRRNIFGKNKYDERQKLIQGTVAIHTLVVMAALQIINALIVIYWHSYTDIFNQVLIILALSMTYYIIEEVIRGAYFGRGFEGRIRFFTVGCILYWLVVIVMLFSAYNKGILVDGQLSQTFLQFLIWLWLAILYTFIVISWHINARKK